MSYPNWYGIKGIKFIWCSSWSDPILLYKGNYYNSSDIEECMWEWYNEECEENNKKPNNDEFEQYMLDNDYEVYEIIEDTTPLEKSFAKKVIEVGAYTDWLCGNRAN